MTTTPHTTQAEVDALVQAAAVLRRERDDMPSTALMLEQIAADLRVRLLGQERLLEDVRRYAAPTQEELLGQRENKDAMETLMDDVRTMCWEQSLLNKRLRCGLKKGHTNAHVFYEEDTDGTDRTDDRGHDSNHFARVDDPARAPSLEDMQHHHAQNMHHSSGGAAAPSLDALMSRAFGGLSDAYIEFAMALEALATLAPSFKALGERLREEARA